MLYYIFGTISLILGLIFLKVAIQDKKDGSTFGTILSKKSDKNTPTSTSRR